MRLLFLILSLLFVHTLYGQTTSINPTQVPDQGEVYWGGTYPFETNPHDTAYGFYNFYLQTLRYSKNGKVQWTLELPERMRSYKAESIYNRTTDSTGANKKLLIHEIDVNKFHYKNFLKCEVLILDNTIAISDRSGFLLVNIVNGSIIVDIPYEFREDYFWFDEGNYSIQSKEHICKGDLPKGSSFISACGENLIHFNEQELFIWNDKNELVKKIRFNPKRHAVKSKQPLRYKALFRIKNFRIKLEGVVYVN